MKRFFKRIIRKIGYRFIRILVPCIIALSLILSFGITASALDINAKGTVFEVKYSEYYTPNSGSRTSILQENGNGFLNIIDADNSTWFQTRVTFNFKDTTTTYGNLKISITSTAETSTNYPYTCFLYGIGFTEKDNIYFENDGAGYILNYTGDFTEQFTIISYFEDALGVGGEFRTLYYDIEFTPFHNGADGGNYDLYERVEGELLNSQKNYLSEGADFVSGLSGMPTSGMLNGLAVVSQFMTRFLAISEFGSIFRISLALGFFAFIVGMGIWASSKFGKSNKDKGGKHSK